MRLHGELASAIRIHVVRLCVAFGVSHSGTRVNAGLAGLGDWVKSWPKNPWDPSCLEDHPMTCKWLVSPLRIGLVYLPVVG